MLTVKENNKIALRTALLSMHVCPAMCFVVLGHMRMKLGRVVGGEGSKTKV